MASEVGAYVPEYNVCTVFHLKDLACNKRKIILAKDVKHYFVPSYEGLSKDEIMEFAKHYSDVEMALPAVEHERLKLHRSYIINVVYTLVGEPFRQWVNNIIEARNRKI